MFSEGVDPHRWVREKLPQHGIRGGAGLGMPAPEKFRSGHLPRAAMPVSRTYGNVADSGSDMDESSDTEVDNFAGRFSVESSPPESRNPRGFDRYYSSEAYSDLSSSRETFGASRVQSQAGKSVKVDGFVEEEEASDSGVSSEYYNSRAGRGVNGGSGGLAKGGLSNDAALGVKSRTENHQFVKHNDNMKSATVDKVTKKAAFQDEYNDLPSAPPIVDFDQDTIQMAGHSVRDRTGSAASTSDVNMKKEASDEHISPTGTHEENDMSKSAQEGMSTAPLIARQPTFNASGLGPWYSVLAYDACVRLCLHAWARGCSEAPIFLENECTLLRKSFSLQHVLLQSEEELMARRSTELVSEGAAPKPKKTIGKLKVQVRKVRMTLDMPSGCSLSTVKTSVKKLDTVRYHLSNVRTALSSGWESVRNVRVVPHLPSNSSFSRQSLAYMHASAQYIKQVSGILKVGVTTLRNSTSYEAVQETYSCQLRLKSAAEDSWIRMQPGSGETHLFLPDSLGDDLIIDVSDSKGKFCGRTIAQVASIAEDSMDKLRWWSIYTEPEHELVGRMQLFINYTTTADENLKYGPVAETVAYDIVLEAGLKAQHFQQRNLILHGPWKWLIVEFASYYGVSDAYTRLRYLSYVMDIATPTEDCLNLVHDMIQPVITQSRLKNSLSYQENRLLGELVEHIEQVITIVFENFKSLDESILSGIVDDLRLPNGRPALALTPAVKLYSLLYDVLSPEAQVKLCRHFQAAARKRLRRYLLETDEYIGGNIEGIMMDVMTITTAYQKMKTLCCNIRNEIFTDIEIHNHSILPSFVDLPNLSASIYSVELHNRLRAFLDACPPTGPSSPVADLIIATDDFQKDLANWNICPVRGGIEAKELFHPFIIQWIRAKCKALADSCKVKWSGVPTQHMTTSFVDEMYEQLMVMLNEYEVIICRWPEYTSVLEHDIADVEKAVIESLDRQYADVLAPLKDFIAPKKFNLKYIEKLAKRNNISIYALPDELGILLNTMKRLLDTLRPRIENQLKAWSSCMPVGGNAVGVGERLGEVTVTLRAKFRNYLQAIVEKLAENTRLQNSTKIKKIIQDSKDVLVESDVRTRMQPLRNLLIDTVNQCHKAFENYVFVGVCRGLWDRLGQDVLNFLENHKENRAWYKGSRIAVSVLDDTFASQMQQLLGNTLLEKDLEPPRSIVEVRSVLCKDAPLKKDSGFYY